MVYNCGFDLGVLWIYTEALRINGFLEILSLA